MSRRRLLGGDGPLGPERIGGVAPETTRLPQPQAAVPATPVVLPQAGRVVGSESEPWWQAAFGEHYETVYAHRSDAAAATEVAGLLPHLRAAGGLVCDACCGNGRHLAAMQAAGLRVVGFDFSQALITAAQQREIIAGRLVRADLRHPPLAQVSFDAVTVLFTAFGYFDDADNAEALAALVGLVRPGGWVIIDLPDPQSVRERLVPESRRQQDDGTIISERRHLTATHVNKDVDIIRDGHVLAHWQERVRLYESRDMDDLATGAGASVRNVWPSLQGAEVEAQRQVYWLQRD